MVVCWTIVNGTFILLIIYILTYLAYCRVLGASADQTRLADTRTPTLMSQRSKPHVPEHLKGARSSSQQTVAVPILHCVGHPAAAPHDRLLLDSSGRFISV